MKTMIRVTEKLENPTRKRTSAKKEAKKVRLTCHITPQARLRVLGLGWVVTQPKTRPVLLCIVLLGFSQSQTDGLPLVSSMNIRFTAFDLLFHRLLLVLARSPAFGSVRPLHAEIQSVFLHPRAFDAPFSVARQQTDLKKTADEVLAIVDA